jgi:hypothetical protein
MKPGRKASRETTELGRCPQRDDPLCASGTTQLFINRRDVPGISWILKEIGHSPQRDDPLCRNGKSEGTTPGTRLSEEPEDYQCSG